MKRGWGNESLLNLLINTVIMGIADLCDGSGTVCTFSTWSSTIRSRSDGFSAQYDMLDFEELVDVYAAPDADFLDFRHYCLCRARVVRRYGFSMRCTVSKRNHERQRAREEARLTAIGSNGKDRSTIVEHLETGNARELFALR